LHSGNVTITNTGDSGTGSSSAGAGQGNAQAALNIGVTGTVVDNRVVNASSVNFGVLHVGASSGPLATNLTSTTSDNAATRVTVSNGNDGVVTISGGTNPTFNGTASDSRNASGNF